MIARRDLLACGAAVFAALPARASLPIPASAMLNFRVVRSGSAIGTHALRFERQETRLVVNIAVDLAVGIGPIAFYRYRHRATETWNDGIITAFDAETNDNGTRSTFALRRERNQLVVESNRAGRYIAPPEALPASHWNRRMLDGPFINTQTGALMRPTVMRAGVEPLPWAPQRRGQRFVLSGDVALETWYDSAEHWLGLRFRGEDGSAIHYEIT